MKLSKTASQLYKEISKLKIIDAHEHLPPEKEYLEFGYSGLNFFAGYIWNDMESAGLSKDFKMTMRNGGYRHISEWWPRIAPYWNKVKHGSFAKAAIITARDLYGIDEINDHTIEKLAACITADNKPGLYKRILKDCCKARKVITNVESIDFGIDSYIKVVSQLDIVGDSVDSLQKLQAMTGKQINSLNCLVIATCERLQALKATGVVVGFKIWSVFHAEPDEYSANEVFKKIKTGEKITDIGPLKDFLFDKLIKTVAELELPISVHAGVWSDFRVSDSKFTIDLARRYPTVHFDLFHLGIPAARDTLIIGKNFPNVSLNLCWCPILSQRMTIHSLDEAIDLIPVNKIIAFGADYRVSIQKVWGHLVMAREVVASVLAGRIESGDMTEEKAMDIAKMWFHDNPSEIYRV